MSWYSTLWEKVYTRLTGDSASLGGLFYAVNPLLGSAGVCLEEAPEAPQPSDFPFIVFAQQASEHVGAFRSDCWQITFAFNTYLEKRPQIQYPTGTPLQTADAVRARVSGDWPAQAAGTGPTFGIDRWTPDITASGWTADCFHQLETLTSHEEGVYHFVDTFRLVVSKAGA